MTIQAVPAQARSRQKRGGSGYPICDCVLINPGCLYTDHLQSDIDLILGEQFGRMGIDPAV